MWCRYDIIKLLSKLWSVDYLFVFPLVQKVKKIHQETLELYSKQSGMFFTAHDVYETFICWFVYTNT